MIESRCHIQLPTHRCHITIDDLGHIVIFKYTDRVCDFAVFDRDKSWDASDYIVEPLPTTYYGVTFPGDPHYTPY